ncbi:hypothetical protein ACODG7_00545 [Vibrio anguillarum]|uniref:hypothetical protein n=1 Tax=Vibrio TaxID=662 RepID=UPI0002E9E64C|nr:MULTISPECIES: hypothetical protein [Vibrio]OEE32009.1 hypothetical protein A1QW_12070 [Vibrio anguillarum]OEF90962.1 hypothetical protein A1QY_01330 [Vibrio anguillarum]OXX52663.1 hypothetical protein B9J80_11190 [Vibrio sp. V12_P9A6T4]
MKYLIFPDDPSVYFMNSVIEKISTFIEDGSVTLIKCNASDDGYKTAYKLIEEIPKGSKVVFIGHSTPALIYGGMSEEYLRKPLVRLKNMSVFKDKELLLVSCFSMKLLESSRNYRNYSKCMGFGLLPSELEEVEAHRGIRNLSLDFEDIENFKSDFSQLMASTMEYFLETDSSMEKLFSYFKIITNKKINENLLCGGNRKVAEVLFYVVNEVNLD